jgi:predicted MFS family arabinose efflux permease
VNSWFDRARGLALGLTFVSNGLFGSLAKLYAAWLIVNSGWQAAYAGLAAFPLLIALPVAFAFFRERTGAPRAEDHRARVESGMTAREALTTRRFWTLIVAVTLLTSTLGGSMPNLEPLLASKGFDDGMAVKLAGLIGLAVLVGRPLGGWLIDRFWAPGVAFLTLSAPIASFLILSHMALTAPLAGFCVLLIGFALGLEYDLIAYLVSRYFGLRAYGVIYGCLFGVFSLGAAVGAYIIGHAFTSESTYDGILNGCAVALFVGAALLLTLGRYPGAAQGHAGNTEEAFAT